MRNLTLAFLMATGLLAFHQEKAQATEYPFCLHHVLGWGGMFEDCLYSNMEQCQMAAPGLNGWCEPNWRLQYRNPDQDPPKRVRARRQS
jgi:hypothetical protein